MSFKNTCDKCNGRTKNTLIESIKERFYCACCDNELYGIVFGEDKNVFKNHLPFTKTEIEDWTAKYNEEEEEEEFCEKHEQVMWKDGLKCGGCLQEISH